MLLTLPHKTSFSSQQTDVIMTREHNHRTSVLQDVFTLLLIKLPEFQHFSNQELNRLEDSLHDILESW